MRSRSKKSAWKRKSLLLSAIAAAMLGVYLMAAYLVWQDRNATETLSNKALDVAGVNKMKEGGWEYSGQHYVEMAKKLQYYSHNPDDVYALYAKGLSKAPADFENFFSFTYYMVTRNCCRDRVLKALSETLRRYPTSPRLHHIATAYFLSFNDTKTAFEHAKSSIELDPLRAKQIYMLLEQKHFGPETLVQVTPKNPEALLQLAYYLTSRENMSPEETGLVVDELSKMDLSSKDRLSLARVAMRTESFDVAASQAGKTTSDPEFNAEAYEILSLISWQKHDLESYEKYSVETEKALAQHDKNKAAQHAVQSANRYASAGNIPQAKTHLLEVLKRYPRFAPAYYELSRHSKNESAEVSLYYLKKAAEFDPSNVDYQYALATHLLEINRPAEARALFERMSLHPDTEIRGYLGLAQVESRSGNTMRAIAVLQAALEKHGEEYEFYIRLGELFGVAGNHRKAAQCYLEAMKLHPRPVDAQLSAGDAYLKAGDYNEARTQYKQVLDRDSNNNRALSSLNRLTEMGW